MSRAELATPPDFSADDVVALRKQLKLSQRQLALRLGVEHPLVVQWERGEAFPTLANSRKLLALREGIPLKRRTNPDPLRGLLNDPEFWEIHRKLLGHRELYEQVKRLARDFADPAKPPPPPSKE